ncbi:MAG: sulfate reduction electron transfer complex DsrMKJOP subunit DsrM [Thermoanaerobaculales bacterium]|jgi:nitrate reductase gamma subunit|nr:sulfate reduction electron transfer complex DsrMKJOP subunit DsrM [Thermoanaerobaculales bacterium]
MGALVSLVAVAVLALLAVVAVASDDLRLVFGAVIPGVAFAIFLLGILARVIRWARAPVPFRIPTTGGQQKSLPWIKNSKLDNPSGTLGVLGRMFLEVFCFRSLFRNTKVELLTDKEKVSYIGTKYLWAAAMAFHWSMLIVVVRHFRFFVEPVPQFVELIEWADGFFQVGVPVIFATSVVLIVSLLYLLARRFFDPKVKYISLPTDYFALYLLLGIAVSGFLMRHLEKVDIVNVKAAIAGWASFQLVVPEGVGVMYFIHVFLVSVLLVYFPFSKLLHAPGVFLSPTRNMANNNRAKRHVNPWNPPIIGHTYAEWEEEFHDKLVASGFALDKE